MTTIDDFLVLIRDEIGLAVGPEHVDMPLGLVPGWDSMHLLALLTALERQIGRPISLPDVLQAESLNRIHEVVVRT
ncbi:acyl carrier protein [Streptomyces sp. NPDC059256]|uniref:acyl carrier protein n=1 Tax=Streptomyces sp. NPDC059256 TaxID=3346794 RepID=UPI0036B121CE